MYYFGYFSCRTRNFESSKSYKTTWGDSGENSDQVVSNQPGRVVNYQQQTSGGTSGGYITR